jgi:hypothetical protein
MRRVVWKFGLATKDTKLEMPTGATLLWAGTQPDDIPGQYRVCLWALVNPDARMVYRTVATRATGKEVSAEWPYVSSFTMGEQDELVFHVFDGGESDLIEKDPTFKEPIE